MKKIVLSMLSLILLVSLATPSFLVSAAPSEQRVIVVFNSKVDRSAVTKANGKVHHEFKNIPALTVTVPTAALNGLKHNPNVKSIESDAVVQVKSQTLDWGIQATNTPAAWNSGYTGKGVKIAVVDTGIAQHEDLLVAGGASFVGYTTSYIDDNGHGTHAAGIIGAKDNALGTKGVAPDASLYAVKVLDGAGSGYLSDIIEGIDWSIANGMHIINLSLGTQSDSTALRSVVDKAYSNGILVVAAAGNDGNADGSGDTVDYPARYDSAIAVAAVDSSSQRASFSSTGSAVEVAAPGVSVLSTYMNNSYARMSGTSMAAPYAAGELALLKQANPTLTNAQLRSKLTGTVKDLGTAGRDLFFGYGLVQAPASGSQTTTASPVVYSTKTQVTPSKSVYYTGQTVSIKAKVLDQNGRALSGAAVKLTITNPLAVKITGSGVTNSYGEVTFTMTTTSSTVKGTYKITAETSKTGYANSAAAASFSIK